MVDDAVRPDLWAKLAALNQCCRVQMTRLGVPGQPRTWRVAVEHANGSVTVEDQSLRRAIVQAIRAVEAARGEPV